MSRNVCNNLSDNDESNSARFLAAYNAIDKKLRRRFRFGAKESFSEMIRKIAGQNYAVRKHESDLLEYARLRNAIVHGETDEPIAEPHDDIVAKIEKICTCVSAPPAVLSKLACRRVDSLKREDTLKTALFTIAEKRHSHLPVVSDGEITGIINGKILTTAIADALRRGGDVEEYIRTTKIGDITGVGNAGVPLYEILPKSATIENAANLFDKNNKLKLILITNTGTCASKILGVVTVADIVKFNNLLSE